MSKTVSGWWVGNGGVMLHGPPRPARMARSRICPAATKNTADLLEGGAASFRGSLPNSGSGEMRLVM